MLQQRRLSPKFILLLFLWSGSYAAAWMVVVYCLYVYAEWQWLKLPFLPISTIGTAVAFYVGFKNNAAYDRFWEGRKIWGGIVNESRTWTSAVLAYVGSGATESDTEVKRRLVYRQLAWINALRLQLRKTSRFFDKPAWATRLRLKAHEAHLRSDWSAELAPFLDEVELAGTTSQLNAAAQLLKRQAEELSLLHKQGRLEVFHQVDLMQILRELYGLQGRCERIKNTPLPRQYAELSRWFVRAFVALVPLGLLSVFEQQILSASRDHANWWQLVPMLVSAALIGWVFITMEGIGDSSEDPFERSINDVPMNAICRTIERDLRQMLGETELPPPEAARGGILY